ncbi:MAG: mechanosensitive ion channel family protein [Verrucomicrobiota bacterium]|nr:mechanosensitive ion channel family protein [Verrucomicrobiota bacterium]
MWRTLVETENAIATVAVFFLVFGGMLAIGRLLKRRAGVPLGVFYRLFCLALSFYAAIGVYGVQTTWRGHAGAAAALLSTALVVGLLDRFLWDYYYQKRRHIVIPRLLREVTAGVIVLVVLLLVLSVGYHAQTELQGLLAGSGVLAIILGFGMQNLMSTLVAGAELQIGKPYKLGDWLKIGEHIGQVVEIRWADTRLRTNDAISIEIPNNKIIAGTIINLSHPTPLHAMRVSVGADYTVPPNRVKDALRRAASHAQGIEADPPPKAYLKEFGDSSILYDVKFWMTSHANYNDVCDSIRTNIWYEFKRQKINIPFPIRTLQVERRGSAKTESKQAETARAVLRKEPLFACLSDEQIEGLLKDAEVNHFGRAEAVIEEGTQGESMFILMRGTAQVSVTKGDSLIRVGVLRQGDCFGEMSLLTGEPRTATVRAEKDCEVIEISKAVMGELLRTSPECLQQLSGLLARRKLETEGMVRDAVLPEVNAAREREYAATFISRLRSFFEL